MKKLNKYLYLVRFRGYSLNPNVVTVNNLPSNSEGLTLLNKFNKDENTVLISGGRILMNTIPEYFSGGNNKTLPKCLSKDKITLPSDLANLAISPLSERKGAFFTSNPSFSNNFTTLLGTFSSENKFNLLLEDDIFFLFDKFRGVIQGRENGFFSESREVISNDFFWCNSSSQQVKNLPNHNSSIFESWLPMTDFAVNDNMPVNFNSHEIDKDNGVFKFYE